MNARVDAAERLLEEFGWDVDHARHVRRLAVSLFDQLQPLHQFGPDERDILDAAALLHDIGWTVAGSKHHKHAYDLICKRADKLAGFARRQVELIAQVARYHRKAPPSLQHPAFANLTNDEQRAVRRLAALLRLADGFDRPHLQSVTELHCGVTDRHVLIGVKALTDPGLHIEGAARKRALFEEAYGLPVEFAVV